MAQLSPQSLSLMPQRLKPFVQHHFVVAGGKVAVKIFFARQIGDPGRAASDPVIPSAEQDCAIGAAWEALVP